MQHGFTLPTRDLILIGFGDTRVVIGTVWVALVSFGLAK
jgi:hypothetical protein